MSSPQHLARSAPNPDRPGTGSQRPVSSAFPSHEKFLSSSRKAACSSTDRPGKSHRLPRFRKTNRGCPSAWIFAHTSVLVSPVYVQDLFPAQWPVLGVPEGTNGELSSIPAGSDAEATDQEPIRTGKHCNAPSHGGCSITSFHHSGDSVSFFACSDFNNIGG